MAKKYLLGPRGAAAVRRLLNGDSHTDARAVPDHRLVFGADMPAPFTLQWSQSQDDGEGSWIIYLPENHLKYGVEYINAAADLESADGYGENWYLAGVDASAEALWLNIDEASGGEIGASLSDSSESGALFSVQIAAMSVDSGDARMIWQLAWGVIVIGADGVMPGDGEIEVVMENGTSEPTTLGSFTVNQSTPTTITIPAIPGAPGDGTITIVQDNGTSEPTTLGSFSVNQSTPTTITIPAAPSPVTPGNGEITIVQENGTSEPTELGSFTVNQSTPTTITIPAAEMSGSVTYVGDIRYDVASHQLQKRLDTKDLATGTVTEGTWTMITGGQATPHSPEHV